VKRSKFSLSHYKLATMPMGFLVPVGVYEVLPGDTVQQATSALVRLTPLVAPVMHPVEVKIHHWFVPYRIVWDNFEKFITGGSDGLGDGAVHPTITRPSVKGGLLDHLGIPPALFTPPFSALPVRAYSLIWNEWYRDQDLAPARALSKGDGVDNITSIDSAKVAWEKDYFTSARPWPQKGPDVTLSLGTSAPVVAVNTPSWRGTTDPNTAFALQTVVGNNNAVFDKNGAYDEILQWNDPGLRTDLTSATALTVNDLREAMALQRYQEARARYGSRYTEYLRFLGVKSSDARLQRPEYLGGGKQTVQFSEVLQTGPDQADEGVASLYGHGIGALRSNRWRRFFEEHGVVLTLMTIKPRTMYAQGLHRHWLRTQKEHYYQRELAHIGQQPVVNAEVYADQSSSWSAVFGWQDRYDEYRRMESGISGDFRDTMNHWHFAREFAAPPVLNESFITSDPTRRVFQEQTADPCWVMCNHSIQARRMVAGSGKSFIF
jgi:hypothetical protein